MDDLWDTDRMTLIALLRLGSGHKVYDNPEWQTNMSKYNVRGVFHKAQPIEIQARNELQPSSACTLTSAAGIKSESMDKSFQ
jgi:hypothetical protein